MASDKQGAIHAASDRGVIGTHPPVEPLQILVGPTTSKEFNTARLRLIPIGCFSVEDVSFKFDSSFVLPDLQPQPPPPPPTPALQLIRSFIDLREKDPERIKGAPISIFGHADPTFQGNFELSAPTHQAGDDYNKVLSGRRAIAIYALLIRDAAIWNNLFTNHFGGDVWGEDSIRIMLNLTDPATPSGQQGSSSGGNTNPGASDSARDAQIRSIAQNAGQRQQLFLKYMDRLCGDLKLDKTKDFLARNAGPDHKGDVQGCSRFNPRLLFSQEKEDSFKEAEKEREKEKDKKKDQPTLDQRNVDNIPNRRVMILIFRKGSHVLPSKWPCPTSKEGSAGCKKRFFSDGDTRRSTHTPGADRKFDQSHDTFACRFFQRLSDKSPCERILTGLFRYGVELGPHLPWSDSATFRIVSEDQSQEQVFTMAQGLQAGNLRVFLFADARPGIRYRGEIRDDKLRLDLFGFVELARIQDANDPLNLLPMPEPGPPPQPKPEDPVDPVPFSGPIEDVDFDAVENAAQLTGPVPPIPPGSKKG